MMENLHIDAYNTIAIVQARMGSKRLPNKMMLSLNGYPVIDWLRLRLEKSSLLTDIIFAIPDTPKDNPLYEHLAKHNAKVVRGSENDVLSRYVQVAEAYDPSYIVRICGDNPLIDPAAVDHLIAHIHASGHDYCYNNARSKLATVGIGAEACTIATLMKIDQLAAGDEREHIFNYIWNNSKFFRTSCPPDDDIYRTRKNCRFDLDTPNDFCYLMSLGITPSSSLPQIIQLAEQTT